MRPDDSFNAIKAVMDAKGYIDIPAHGDSMFPLIRSGNICRFTLLQGGQARIGDILLFQSSSGVLVGHRIRKIMHDGQDVYFVCKGDSNLAADAPVHCRYVLGRMWSVQTSRRLLRTDFPLAAWWGKIIVSLPAISYMIHIYVRRKREARRQSTPLTK